MATAAVTFPGSFSFETMGLTGPEGGVNLGIMGQFNQAGFHQLMKQTQITPRDPNWLAEIDQGARQLDNLDLRLQYDRRVVPIVLEHRMTAAELNSQNDFLYKRLCPVQITNEFNFSYENYEVYMAPFDKMNPLQFARVTGWQRTQYQATLQMFKRSQEAEMTLLSDPIHGPGTMARMQYAIDKQAELTMIVQISLCLVETPLYAYFKKIQHPVNAFNHARELINEAEETFSASRGPSIFMNHVEKRITSTNRCDSLVIPKGADALMITMEGEPKPLEAFKPVFDTEARRVLLTAYKNGVTSFRSFSRGNGAQLDVFVMEPLKGYSSDPDEMACMPLRSIMIMAEIMTGNGVSYTDLLNSSKPLNGKMLDILGVEHTPLQIRNQRISFRAMLDNNLMFLDNDGQTMSLLTQGLSDYYVKLALEYNSDDNMKKQFKEAFRLAEHRDNNNASPNYLGANMLLSDMHGCRHFEGFLCYDDVRDEVTVPLFVGDIEPKTLPPIVVFQTAEVLTQHLEKGVANDDDVAYVTKLAAFLVTSHMVTAVATALRTPDPAAGGGPPAPPPHAPSVQTAIKRLIGDMINSAAADHPTVLVGEERRFISPTPTSFKAPAGSLIAPRDGETKQEYTQRVTPAAIHDAVVEDGTLDASTNAWLHMLQHVPDSALNHFLSLVYATHKDGQAQLSDEDNEHLADLSATLAATSRMGHVTATLKAVVEQVESTNASVGKVFQARAGQPWLSTQVEQRLNAQKVAKASHLATAIGEHIASLGHAATDLPTRPDNAGANQNFANRFSWRMFNEILRTQNTASRRVLFTYVFLLQCKFNHMTCERLARLGLPLFVQNYIRLFVEQTADSMVLLRAGQETWFLAVGHGQVLTSTSGAEASFAMHAQMHMGVILTGGALNMSLIANALPREHVSGRTLEPIRNIDDLNVAHARDRRSVIVVSTPVTETKRVYPLTLTGDLAYKAGDTHSHIPTQKISCHHIIRQFLVPDWFDLQLITNDNLAQYYSARMSIATHLHQACIGLPVSSDPSDNNWRIQAGTGPLGAPEVNIHAAVQGWMGMAAFPQMAPAVVVY